MKSKPSSFSVIMAFVATSLLGLACIPLLSIKLMPSKSLPTANVYFSMPGYSSRVVEMDVTCKLEAMLNRISSTRKITSISGNGWGEIHVEIDKHCDLDAARFEISMAIRQLWPQLPAGLSYPSLNMSRPDDDSRRAFMAFTVNAPSSPAVIMRYAENRIKPQLAAISGISQIDVSGAMPMEWQLQYNAKQLAQLGVSVNDIRTALDQHLKKEFLGLGQLLNSDGDASILRVVLEPRVELEQGFNAADINVLNKEGKLIRLDQLVSVQRQEEQPRSYYRINGLNSIYLTIYANDNANQLVLGENVRQALASLKQTLPAEYEIHQSYDATEYIAQELDKIYVRSGLTLLILLLFVFAVSRSLRYMLLIVVSLAVNLCIAAIFYYLLKVEIQLYSLAGITVSMTLLIDNTIVMADHLLHRRNLKAFPAILAATLTTIAALSIVFLLDDRVRLNLQDFSYVIIINLSISLLTALFLVPALIDRLGLQVRKSKPAKRSTGWLHRWRGKRRVVYFSHFYQRLIAVLVRWRTLVLVLVVLAFGLPTFMLPEKWEADSVWSRAYQATLGTTFYKETLKKPIDIALGGTLRLFVKNVYEGSYLTSKDETILRVSANAPNGTTLTQMNDLVQKMEVYLTQFKEVRQFQTSIYEARKANINIMFVKEHQHSGFPYQLKSKLISKALELGSATWGIYGLEDQGFNNDVREMAGQYHIVLYGYNYDELNSWAERLKLLLLENRRIKEVSIGSEFDWVKDDYREYQFMLDKQSMALLRLQPIDLYASLHNTLGRNVHVGSVLYQGQPEQLRLSSAQWAEYDIWALGNSQERTRDVTFKLNDLAHIEKVQAPQKIAKEIQQYRLCLQYDYIGAYEQGRKQQERVVDDFAKNLPLGYTVEGDTNNWGWSSKDNRQYLLLLIIALAILFLCSILFNSLKQALAIIFIIPVSYIGVFLTFYLFHFNFDQGGFASFVLLCGITVNASIYLINEFNSIRKTKPLMARSRAYIGAWNAKVIPILLTITSTMLGFVPFLVGAVPEAFWFPLAAGTIGGLACSMVGLFFLLPLMLGLKAKD